MVPLKSIILTADNFQTWSVFFREKTLNILIEQCTMKCFTTSTLSSKSSGRKCYVSFRYKSFRHDLHTGDEKK
jgi:hypothetical protein